MRAPDQRLDRAMEILRELATARGLTVARIIGPCRRIETSAARKAFCLLAVDNGIRTRDIAEILACDTSTVSYHISPTAKARKKRNMSRDRGVAAWCALIRARDAVEHA